MIKRVLFSLILVILTGTAFAQSNSQIGWFIINNGVHIPTTEKKLKPGYALEVSLGGNVNNYVAITFDTALSVNGEAYKYNLEKITVGILLHKAMNLTDWGFRPYLGIGVGAVFASQSTEQNPEYGIFHKNYKGIDFALNTSAGIRFFYNSFITGIDLKYSLLDVSMKGGVGNVDYSGISTTISIGMLF